MTSFGWGIPMKSTNNRATKNSNDSSDINLKMIKICSLGPVINPCIASQLLYYIGNWQISLAHLPKLMNCYYTHEIYNTNKFTWIKMAPFWYWTETGPWYTSTPVVLFYKH